MFSPDSKFKSFWTVILVFLLLYTAIIMPYKIALIDDQNGDIFYILDTTVDFLFMFDIFINLNSPLEETSGNYNFHRK